MQPSNTYQQLTSVYVSIRHTVRDGSGIILFQDAVYFQGYLNSAGSSRYANLDLAGGKLLQKLCYSATVPLHNQECGLRG